jgi:hypothetical protein
VSVWLVCRLVRDAELSAIVADAALASSVARLWAPPDGPEELRDRWAPCSPDEYLDLDKSWAGLSSLLTGDVDAGEPWPAAGAAFGGTWLGDGDDMILGLTSQQVGEVDAHLQAHPFADLWGGLTGESLVELLDYEEGWPRDTVDEYRKYLHDWYAELVAFFHLAAAREMAMIKIIVA